ncbi:unnamed protein product [Spodoptera exigua]|nr:unnamed protein product [Spodoptera exigua]
MSDLCNEQDIGDNIYTNTYSLWGNSKYYDIKNLSPQNFANRNGTIGSEIGQEFRATRWVPSKPEVEVKKVPPDPFKRRTITKESLYQDPDKNNKIKDDLKTAKKSSSNFDWTLGYWDKAAEQPEQDGGQGSSRGKKQVLGGAKIQKKLDKMLAKPVKMTKAESMMQKMGWQGGALGRSGDGIVEPIAPNAVYSSTKVGFGQLQLLKQPKSKQIEKKQFYETNVLHSVYEFVKNNNEIELLFDKSLRRDERKKIHHIIQFKVLADDLASVDFDSTAQVELVLQISNNNCYLLHTKSSGSYPNRQLSLFKKAPDHVFLIVPQDLKKTKEGNTEDKPLEVDCKEDIVPETPEDQKDQNRQMDQESEELEPEETNPFLISITRNLKKNTDSEMKEEVEIAEIPENPVVSEAEKIPEEPVNSEMSDEVMKLIFEYYKKFKGNRRYSQFKFLGPFDEEEIVCINEFIQQATRYLNKEPCPYASVFDDVEFEINEDCTGNTVIFKRPV